MSSCFAQLRAKQLVFISCAEATLFPFENLLESKRPTDIELLGLFGTQLLNSVLLVGIPQHDMVSYTVLMSKT